MSETLIHLADVPGDHTQRCVRCGQTLRRTSRGDFWPAGADIAVGTSPDRWYQIAGRDHAADEIECGPFSTVGMPAPEATATCAFSMDWDSEACARTATVHLCVNSSAWGIVALQTCTEHSIYAAASAPVLDTHPFTADCVHGGCWPAHLIAKATGSR